MKRVTSGEQQTNTWKNSGSNQKHKQKALQPQKACSTARQRSARMTITRMRVSKEHHSAGAVACCMLLCIGFFSATVNEGSNPSQLHN
jgi:hypothetical protein